MASKTNAAQTPQINTTSFPDGKLQCKFQNQSRPRRTQVETCVLQCLSGGYLPMGSNQINTQSAVIQILPLAIPAVLESSTGMAVVWHDSNHQSNATAYQTPNTQCVHL
jgi:hypothetical protein